MKAFEKLWHEGVIFFFHVSLGSHVDREKSKFLKSLLSSTPWAVKREFTHYSSSDCCVKRYLSILLRFRLHAFVVSDDISKMYRQILVDPSQRNLQQILWRFDPLEPLHAYVLKTITYVTAATSFYSHGVFFSYLMIKKKLRITFMLMTYWPDLILSQT